MVTVWPVEATNEVAAPDVMASQSTSRTVVPLMPLRTWARYTRPLTGPSAPAFTLPTSTIDVEAKMLVTPAVVTVVPSCVHVVPSVDV